MRSFYWQDSHVEFEGRNTLATGLLKNYQREAERIVTQGGVLIPNQPIEQGDARMIIHPPGYSILLAILYGNDVSNSGSTRIRLLQVLCDSVASVLVFLIAFELLPLAVAIIAGMLVALSPHLAYYSLWLTPESLSALPVLLAIYLLARAIKKPRLITIIVAGVCVGLACWFRSNALLLAPFLALTMFFLFDRSKRMLYSAAFVGAMIIVISPITIRNLVVFDRFIPLSIGAGITMIEGIADYDNENRFGMPKYDKEVALKDAEWHNRPDYAGNLWMPDGVERDRARFARGLEVIRSNPGWFLKVMARRAAFMLRYNDEGSADWPFNTARAPLVSAEPGFYHKLTNSQSMPEAWSESPEGLLAAGTILSQEAKVNIAPDNETLQITGDGSAYGDQFNSAPVPVKKNTDYLLVITVEELQGPMAAKVTDIDRRIALASKVIPDPDKGSRKAARKRKRAERRGEQVDTDEQEIPPLPTLIELSFASGDRDQVLLAISNNGPADARPLVKLGRARLVEFGPTPYAWTGAARAVVRAIQKNVYVTYRMVPLILAGVVLMLLARRRRDLLILLAAPLYYLSVQSALHTEYRYILAMHYFLFILAAVTLYCLGSVIARTAESSLKSIQKPPNRRFTRHAQ